AGRSSARKRRGAGIDTSVFESELSKTMVRPDGRSGSHRGNKLAVSCVDISLSAAMGGLAWGPGCRARVWRGPNPCDVAGPACHGGRGRSVRPPDDGSARIFAHHTARGRYPPKGCHDAT